MDLRVTGSAHAAAIGKALKAQGSAGKGHRREVLRGIQRTTKPLKAAGQEGARRDLPREGGLNEVVAGSKFSTRTRLSGKNPGVRITVTGRAGQVRDVRATDRGRLRHPVYGHRDRWVTQQIPPGWFTHAMEASAPMVRAELLRSMENVLQKIIREGASHR